MTLLTEKESAEKWCPLSRVATPVTAHLTGHVITAIACNRSSRSAPDQNLKAEVSPDSARCIGSRCMAWRSESVRHDDTCEYIAWAASDRSQPVKRCNCSLVPTGYCGAFGKVQP